MRWANVGLVAITLLAYASPYISPLTFWPLAIPGLFYPWFVIFNLLFAAYWLWKGKMNFLLSLGCILVGFSYFQGFFGFSLGGNSTDTETDIVVMSFNCHGFWPKEKGAKRATPDAMAELLDTYQPDVLCLQEFPYPEASGPYIDYLTTKGGLPYVYQHAKGALAVFSRFPIKKKSARYFTNNANGYLFADLDLGRSTVRVYNIHLQTNAVSRMADEIAAEKQFQETETWLRIKGMMGRYGRSARRRAEQAEEIAIHANQSPHPAILCGDFNDVPTSYTYRLLAGARQDAFRSKGAGPGTTFTGSIPMLRIDYILADPAMRIRSFKRADTDFSDHYPIVSRMEAR